MYRNEYEKIVEQVKTVVELARDCGNITRCENILRNFERGQALACLQEMIWEYKSQINIFGFWVDRTYVNNNLPLEQLGDIDIQNQLQYIACHIPAYILLREGEKELAKQICQWLDQ